MRVVPPAKRLPCLERVLQHESDDLLQGFRLHMPALERLDVALELRGVVGLEHQMPRLLNISSAFEKRGFPSAMMASASRTDASDSSLGSS